jgi:hypothetical protein
MSALINIKHDAFDPANYNTLGYFYDGPSEAILAEYSDEMNYLDIELERFGTSLEEILYSGWDRTCDACGTAFFHGAIFEDVRTSTLVRVGGNCGAQYFGAVSKARVMSDLAKRAEENAAMRVKADAFIAEHDLADVLTHDHHIVQSIKGGLFRYGSISDKQIALIFKIQREDNTREEVKATERPGTPVVAGDRLVVTGKIISLKLKQNNYNPYGPSIPKIVVQVDDADNFYRVWGTLSASLEDAGADIGSVVTFTANVDRSDDDESFGFFKRPSKASVVA